MRFRLFLYHTVHVDMHQQQPSPFCDRLFRETLLEEHVMAVHRKVRVRKGSNYRWMDESEVKKMVAGETIAPVKRGGKHESGRS